MNNKKVCFVSRLLNIKNKYPKIADYEKEAYLRSKRLKVLIMLETCYSIKYKNNKIKQQVGARNSP